MKKLLKCLQAVLGAAVVFTMGIPVHAEESTANPAETTAAVEDNIKEETTGQAKETMTDEEILTEIAIALNAMQGFEIDGDIKPSVTPEDYDVLEALAHTIVDPVVQEDALRMIAEHRVNLWIRDAEQNIEFKAIYAEIVGLFAADGTLVSGVTTETVTTLWMRMFVLESDDLGSYLIGRKTAMTSAVLEGLLHAEGLLIERNDPTYKVSINVEEKLMLMGKDVTMTETEAKAFLLLNGNDKATVLSLESMLFDEWKLNMDLAPNFSIETHSGMSKPGVYEVIVEHQGYAANSRSVTPTTGPVKISLTLTVVKDPTTPVEPGQPEPETPKEPETTKPALPKTGQNVLETVVAGGGLSLFGLASAMLSRRKK